MASAMRPHRTLLPWWKAAAVAAALLTSSAALAGEAQTPVDRSDPAVLVEEEREAAPPPAPAPTPASAIAAPDPNGVALSGPPIVAGAIRVEGAEALPPSAFAAAIEPYLGRPLAREDLQVLVRDVAAAARRAGYGLATAWIPPQTVAHGVLRVRIEEGRIDAVEASGPAAAAVQRRLMRLAGRRPVRTAALERQLLLAGDLAGVTVGRARLVRRGERNLLLVATSLERVVGRASIDNWGTDAIGPVRARLSVDVNGVVGFGDRLSVGGALTPLQPREFQLVHAAYSVPLGQDGTEAGVRGYLSRSAAGGALRDRDLAGDSSEIELRLSHPLVRSRARSLWGHAQFAVRDSALDRDGARLRDERIVTATGTLYGTARLARGLARARLSLVQGLDLLDATRRGDPLGSRADAGGVFTKVRAWADYHRALGKGFSVELSGEGQLATRPLPASEEMGLGGRSFLRGYDYREFAGDRGVAGAVELRYDLRDLPRPLRGAQLYAYADAGHVSNLRGGFGGGSLASAGGGARVRLDYRLDLGVELGIPLADGAGGRRPNPRLSVTLSTRF